MLTATNPSQQRLRRWRTVPQRTPLSLLFLALLFILSTLPPPAVHAGDNGGGALDLDGTDDFVNIGDVGLTLSAFTVEFWMKPDVTTDDKRILSDLSGSTNDFAVRFQSGRIQTWPGWAFVTSSTITAGQWTHIAFTRNGSTTTGFVNGVQELSAANTATGAGPLGVGAKFLTSWGTTFDGQWDELRFWNAVRTPAEIQATMFKELTGGEANLVAYYKFNDGTGSSIAADSSGNGNTGTLVNVDAATAWVTSTAPVGDSTVTGHTDVSGFWSQHAPASSGGLTIANNTFLVDPGDDIVFGHSATSARTAADVPTTGAWAGASDPMRWQRTWYCDLNDQNSNGGTVDLTFDFAQAGMGADPAPAGPTGNYRLLERAGTSGLFTDLGGASTVDSGSRTVTFTGVNVSGLCSYLTLGTLDNTSSPTAITLNGFDAHGGDARGALLPLLLLGLWVTVAAWVRLTWRRRAPAAPTDA